MAALLPVFPLGMVAFPGMVVPLHVFEDRYRAMVADLLTQAGEDRCFGIVAIREGYEVGAHEARSMYRIGTTMRLSSVDRHEDGRFDIAAVGLHRMRVTGTDTSAAYLRAEVEVLQDGPGRGAAVEAAATLGVFEDYRRVLGRLRGAEVLSGSLPRDPALLGYALAAACAFTLPQRQQLLEVASPAERLVLLRRLLAEELRAISVLPSLPATDVARSRWSPN